MYQYSSVPSTGAVPTRQHELRQSIYSTRSMHLRHQPRGKQRDTQHGLEVVYACVQPIQPIQRVHGGPPPTKTKAVPLKTERSHGGEISTLCGSSEYRHTMATPGSRYEITCFGSGGGQRKDRNRVIPHPATQAARDKRQAEQNGKQHRQEPPRVRVAVESLTRAPPGKTLEAYTVPFTVTGVTWSAQYRRCYGECNYFSILRRPRFSVDRQEPAACLSTQGPTDTLPIDHLALSRPLLRKC